MSTKQETKQETKAVQKEAEVAVPSAPKKVELGSGKTPQYPRFLDITDMPSDQFNVCGDLRNQLCKTVNYCKQYPAKTELLMEVLKYTAQRLKQITALQAEEKAAKEANKEG